MTVKRIRCQVQGVVQGVFYRAHTKEWARQLGLTGWVRNKPDGSVEILAEGDEKKLKELIVKLKKGPPAGRVEDCQIKWQPPTGKFSSFNVRFT
jgi:acylphosphatase